MNDQEVKLDSPLIWPQAVTKCGTVAPPVRGTTYFARHKMVNVNNTIFFLLPA